MAIVNMTVALAQTTALINAASSPAPEKGATETWGRAANIAPQFTGNATADGAS